MTTPGIETQDGAAGTASTGTTGSTAAATTGTTPHQATGTTAGGNSQGAGATSAGGATSAAPAGNSGGGNGSGTGATSEDRSKWHPPHVNQRLSGENGKLKQEAQRLREQLAAVTGITPPKQETPRELPDGVTEADIARARKEFALVYPELAGMDAETLTAIREFVENDLPQFRDQHQHYWNQIGTSTGRALQSEIKSQIGDLSPKGTAALYGAFKTLLESNDEFYERYRAGDPQLITDFIAEYKTEVLDVYHTRQTSAATAAASGTVARATRLPRGGTTSTVIPAAQQEEKPKTEEALHKRAWNRIQEKRRAATA